MSQNKTYRDAIQQTSGALNAKTQRARILRLLIDARGGWVPLPELLACAAQYSARVLELRRLGFVIENKTERVNGARHSWFRLAEAPDNGESAPTENLSESDYMRREREERARAMPLFEGVRQ